MMQYTSIKYVTNPITSENCSLLVKKDETEVVVPLDPANKDYAAIMALVEAGELTIAPAEEPSE